MRRFAGCIALTITVLFANPQVPFSAAGTGTPTTVVVPGVLQLTITYSPTVCSYANGSIVISVAGGTAPYQFSDDGVTFQSNGRFTGLYNGNYSVVVKDAAGQQNSTAITLNLAGTTTMLAISAYVKPTGCGTADGSMTVEGYNPYGEAPPFQYSMDGVNYQSNNTFPNLSAGNYTFFVKDAAGCIDTAYYPLFPNDETYTVTAYSSAGCEGSGVIRVKVYAGPNIYVPNAFTPNGDGHNDILKAIPVGISQFRFFRIYNRYGQLVFSTSDAARGWDGCIAGTRQGTATFVWQAEGVDYQGRLVVRQGTVVLVR